MEEENQNVQFLDLPEELLVKIFSECQCLKPLLETSRKCRDIIKTNKCLYNRLIWNLDRISRQRCNLFNLNSKENSIVNDQLFSVKIMIPANRGIEELMEKSKNSIEVVKLDNMIPDLDTAYELSSLLQKMENLKELDYSVTRGCTYRHFFTLNQVEMPTFSNLNILRIDTHYTTFDFNFGSYLTSSSQDIVSIFRNVTNLKELIIYNPVLNDGKLVLQQESLKKLNYLLNRGCRSDFLDGVKIPEIRGNVRFQLEELVIENPQIFKCGLKILEFLKNQTSLKKFVFRLFYEDLCAQQILPQIYSQVFQMKNLRHMEINSPYGMELNDFSFNPSVRSLSYQQDLGPEFNKNFHIIFPNLEDLEVKKDLLFKIITHHVKNLKIL